MKLFHTILWALIFTVMGVIIPWGLNCMKTSDKVTLIFMVIVYCVLWVMAICLATISREEICND